MVWQQKRCGLHATKIVDFEMANFQCLVQSLINQRTRTGCSNCPTKSIQGVRRICCVGTCNFAALAGRRGAGPSDRLLLSSVAASCYFAEILKTLPNAYCDPIKHKSLAAKSSFDHLPSSSRFRFASSARTPASSTYSNETAPPIWLPRANPVSD
jgi:hypothetical protein